MSNIAVRVDSLSKRYRIGTAADRQDTLRDALAHALRAPFRNLTQLRKLSSFQDAEEQDVVWALRNVSFDVKYGEVLGIIGRNGAGKSTLLKILSRITEPSAGRAEVHGRIGSLLEVGTGFHPELTGRENVYLNGSILGMDRTYIDRKFDQIIDFAEVEKFIDTPVKRYSSGMYLRLAFAVAAHLEPDVLIVDEVLAVGDAEFQNKCIGKMGEVAHEGRAVLLVSHNMQAISQLTQRCVLLAGGQREYEGPTHEALKVYGSKIISGREGSTAYVATSPPRGNRLLRAEVHTSGGQGSHLRGDPITFEFVVEVTDPRRLYFAFQIANEYQQPVCIFWFWDSPHTFKAAPGRYRLVFSVPKLRLYQGLYTLTTWLDEQPGITTVESRVGICPFRVVAKEPRSVFDWSPGEAVYLEDGAWAPVALVNHGFENGGRGSSEIYAADCA